MTRRPKRCDIWHTSITNIKGTEIQGERFRLVLSDPIAMFGSETVICAAITKGGSSSRDKKLTVSLQNLNLKTEGVVLCHQIKTVDLIANNATYVETVPIYLVDEVLKKLAILLQIK